LPELILSLVNLRDPNSPDQVSVFINFFIRKKKSRCSAIDICFFALFFDQFIFFAFNLAACDLFCPKI